MEYNDVQIEKAKTSPALKVRSKNYPTKWHDQVPAEIKMLRTVRNGLPFGDVKPLMSGKTYPCWVNSQGAVSGIDINGETLGVTPDEFEVVTFWGQEAWKFW